MRIDDIFDQITTTIDGHNMPQTHYPFHCIYWYHIARCSCVCSYYAMWSSSNQR